MRYNDKIRRMLLNSDLANEKRFKASLTGKVLLKRAYNCMASKYKTRNKSPVSTTNGKTKTGSNQEWPTTNSSEGPEH